MLCNAMQNRMINPFLSYLTLYISDAPGITPFIVRFWVRIRIFLNLGSRFSYFKIDALIRQVQSHNSPPPLSLKKAIVCIWGQKKSVDTSSVIYNIIVKTPGLCIAFKVLQILQHERSFFCNFNGLYVREERYNIRIFFVNLSRINTKECNYPPIRFLQEFILARIFWWLCFQNYLSWMSDPDSCKNYPDQESVDPEW